MARATPRMKNWAKWTIPVRPDASSVTGDAGMFPPTFLHRPWQRQAPACRFSCGTAVFVRFHAPIPSLIQLRNPSVIQPCAIGAVSDCPVRTRQRGFSLIEMLVVVAVLAAIAYVGFAATGDTQTHAENHLAKTQMLNLAQALRRFRADTGYYPGQGPFALNQPCTVEGENIAPGAVIADFVPAGVNACAWYNSPANLWLLFSERAPSADPSHPQAALLRWDADSGRGWNGPYLAHAALGFVDVGTGIDQGVLLPDLPALSAGTAFAPWPGGFLQWRSLPKARPGYDARRHDFSRHPRALLHLDLERPSGGHPRLQHPGPDGRYGRAAAADPCLPDATDPQGADDLIVCLD